MIAALILLTTITCRFVLPTQLADGRAMAPSTPLSLYAWVSTPGATGGDMFDCGTHLSGDTVTVCLEPRICCGDPYVVGSTCSLDHGATWSAWTLAPHGPDDDNPADLDHNGIPSVADLGMWARLQATWLRPMKPTLQVGPQKP